MRASSPPPRPDDARFMERALALADTAVRRGQTPFGAVVVDRDGQVVGEGHNTARADRDPTAHGRVVLAARGTDVPTCRPLLGADLTAAAAWVNAQPGWSPVEIVGDFMGARALETIARFPWSDARSRAPVEPSG